MWSFGALEESGGRSVRGETQQRVDRARSIRTNPHVTAVRDKAGVRESGSKREKWLEPLSRLVFSHACVTEYQEAAVDHKHL